jgi:hypothetical protein
MFSFTFDWTSLKAEPEASRSVLSLQRAAYYAIDPFVGALNVSRVPYMYVYSKPYSCIYFNMYYSN